MLFFGVFLRESARTAVKNRTNLSTNSGKATKRLGRLAPNLDTCANSYGNGYTPNKLPLETQGWFWGGQQFKSLGKLSDWHQIWFTSADSSGNGHRLNTSRPSIPQVAFRGGGRRVSQIQKSGKAVNRLNRLAPNLAHICRSIWEWMTDLHQLWFTSADSSGNGHRLNPSRAQYPRGHLGGGVGGHKFKSFGKLSNGCTDWHHILYKSADSSGIDIG